MAEWRRGGSRNSLGASEDEEEPASGAINPMGLPLKALQKLKKNFEDEDGNLVALTQEQFVQALSANHKAADQAQREQWHSELCMLFKKIDANCTDRVDWEEFTSYMLVHMPGFNQGEGTCELSSAGGADMYAAAWGCGHMDMINCITVVPDCSPGGERAGAGGASGGVGGGGVGANLRRYITAGRDGFIKVWHPNLTIHRAIDVGQNKSWLAACCWMQKSRRLAVASSRFKIFFYDSNFGNTSITHIDHKDGTPLCLGYNESHESDGREKEILMVGDNIGCVTVYPMDYDWTETTSSNENSDPLRFKIKPTRTRYHGHDWVTKVGFVPELQAMVTCGLDGEINLCDLHVNQRKEGRQAIKLHKKGVHSWCWCGTHKFFASGGLDRQIIIWNPYTQKAMNYLQGHNAAVLDVLVNEEQHQLISLSVDKVVKVWDMLNYRCMQTFTDKTEYKPEDRITCMAFDREGPALVMCSNTINVLPVSVKVETSRTHLAPIVGALYNDDFHQIVSGDSLGTVIVWDVRTGKLEFEFRVVQHHRLTCMAFDESKRRLYTGAEDGVVKLWNFSSGDLLRRYTMRQPAEITRIMWAREGPNTFVVGLSWERIYIWPDANKKQTVDHNYTLEDTSGQGHTDDTSCICRLQSGQLATGGDDGYVIFWKIQEKTSASASSRRYRLFDNTPNTECQESQKPEDQDSKGSKRGKKGAGKGSSKGAAAEGGANAAARYGRPSVVAFPEVPSSGQQASSSSADGAAGTSPQAAQSCMESQGRSIENSWPEELGFEDTASLAVAGVEHMIYLEWRECLLTSHTDRIFRAWSTKTAEFLFRLELLVEQEPLLSEEAVEDDMDPLEALANGKVAPSGSSGGKKKDERQQEKLGMMGLPGRVDSNLVNGQAAAVTTLYVDGVEDRVLFTGDAEGFVRLWNLAHFNPHTPHAPRHLLRTREFQPHKQAVTHLQKFDLEGRTLLMSASLDCTIALCTINGERIGTFSSKGKPWRLCNDATWQRTPPSLEEGPRPTDEDNAWSLSPRRAGKSGGRGAGGKGGPAAAGVPGMRNQRSAQTRVGSRPAAAPAAAAISNKARIPLEKFAPDLTIIDSEKQRLAKQFRTYENL